MKKGESKLPPDQFLFLLPLRLFFSGLRLQPITYECFNLTAGRLPAGNAVCPKRQPEFPLKGQSNLDLHGIRVHVSP
jgi:hypothetical protein